MSFPFFFVTNSRCLVPRDQEPMSTLTHKYIHIYTSAQQALHIFRSRLFFKISPFVVAWFYTLPLLWFRTVFWSIRDEFNIYETRGISVKNLNRFQPNSNLSESFIFMFDYSVEISTSLALFLSLLLSLSLLLPLFSSNSFPLPLSFSPTLAYVDFILCRIRQNVSKDEMASRYIQFLYSGYNQCFRSEATYHFPFLFFEGINRIKTLPIKVEKGKSGLYSKWIKTWYSSS